MFRPGVHSNHYNVIRSLMISYIFTGLMLLLLAFIMYKCDITDKQVDLGINAIYMIACFVGGLLCGKSIGSHRLVWGIVTGMIYFIILFAISLLVNREISSMGHFFLVLGLCILGGIIGGVTS